MPGIPSSRFTKQRKWHQLKWFRPIFSSLLTEPTRLIKEITTQILFFLNAIRPFVRKRSLLTLFQIIVWRNRLENNKKGAQSQKFVIPFTIEIGRIKVLRLLYIKSNFPISHKLFYMAAAAGWDGITLIIVCARRYFFFFSALSRQKCVISFLLLFKPKLWRSPRVLILRRWISVLLCSAFKRNNRNNYSSKCIGLLYPPEIETTIPNKSATRWRQIVFVCFKLPIKRNKQSNDISCNVCLFLHSKFIDSPSPYAETKKV